MTLVCYAGIKDLEINVSHHVYTTMPTKCGFCYEKESYRNSVELHTEDEVLKCKICNRGFFETNDGTDDNTNDWNRTNYRSH